MKKVVLLLIAILLVAVSINAQSIYPKMAPIPAIKGFQMGAPVWDTSAQLPHRVNISTFSISKYEVSIDQYVAFLNAGGNDDHWHINMEQLTYCGIMRNGPNNYSIRPGKADYPVTFVSWYDAVAYCDWLLVKTGDSYRFPTEAEWEYAAVGNKGLRTYPWGNIWRNTYCNNGEDYETRRIDGYAYTSPVGSFKKGKSIFGIYDMVGNVWEWCSDWAESDYAVMNAALSIATDIVGFDSSSSQKILRGGAFSSPADNCCCSCPLAIEPSITNSIEFGFRPVKSP